MDGGEERGELALELELELELRLERQTRQSIRPRWASPSPAVAVAVTIALSLLLCAGADAAGLLAGLWDRYLPRCSYLAGQVLFLLLDSRCTRHSPHQFFITHEIYSVRPGLERIGPGGEKERQGSRGKCCDLRPRRPAATIQTVTSPSHSNGLRLWHTQSSMSRFCHHVCARQRLTAD